MRITGILLIILWLLAPLYSEENITIETREDWMGGEILFDISVALPSGEMKPTNRFVAERAIESEAPGLISEELRDLSVDSWDKMGSLYYSNTSFFGRLENLIDNSNKVFSMTSPDMKRFIIRYKLNFFPDLVSLFIAHDRPVTPDYISTLGSDQESFTGLAIYAGDPVGYHGTDGKILLEPALFPAVYDEDMNLIFDKTFVEPEFIKSWGMVQYTDTIPDSFLETRDRIGMKPLKISLREVYGRNKCDPVISREDGSMILSSLEISNWLREGRVLIILGR